MEDNSKTDNSKIKEYIVHQPLSNGKKFYLSEFLAEKSIKFFAFLSIAIIIAIFYFVFTEAKYAFDEYTLETETVAEEPPATDGSSSETAAAGEYKPESYNPGEQENTTASVKEEKPEQYKPEQYDPNEKSSGELQPEQYKPEQYNPNESSVAEVKPEEYKPESYSPDNDESNGKAEPASEAAGNGIGEAAVPEPLPVEDFDSAKKASYSFFDFLVPNDTIEGKSEYVWQPISSKPKFSIVPLFVGSLKLTLIGILIAAPIAILAAIFTSMFASKRLKEIIKPAIEILAGFPSVVIGFFCLITLASVIQEFTNSDFRLNAFVGGVGISLAVIPIIYTITEDSLAAVPKHLKEASLAMGASMWQTAFRVILPAAVPGVFAAILLGFGRAFGETMIALMATGNAALISGNIFEPIRTMSATVGAEMAEVEYQGVHYGILFLIGSLLFVITFTLNAVAEFYVRKRLIKRFSGK